MRKNGYEKILSKVKIHSTVQEKFRTALYNCMVDEKGGENYFAWVSAVLALKAIVDGNFGIGSVLVDNDNEIVVEGHNRVFHPFFRSDRHAEMVVLNAFEESNKFLQYDVGDRLPIPIKEYTLYSSLEPCPMCFSRLISAGIGKVRYTVEDDTGGFVRRIDEMPEAWVSLASEPYKQSFKKTECSSEIYSVSKEIFLHNVDALNSRLRQIYKV